ncbi:efflux transporter outer membrane subunit [Tistrella sp. BH-R2-4]|uniref:Efflux transporter outer membrane subunit n=1 Tax=Tistrella arctica TaxID=3133430 RepID=A0ABU9YMU0_9PROT
MPAADFSLQPARPRGLADPHALRPDASTTGRRRRRSVATMLAAALLLSACALAPDDAPPVMDTGSGWGERGRIAAAERAADLPDTDVDADWWRNFDDPALTRLVEEALLANDDLLLAIERVTEARATARGTGADLFPSLDGSGDAARNGLSDASRASTGGVVNSFSASAALSYELDLWGRLSNADRAARARLLQTLANRDVVRLTIAADTANAYLQMRSLDLQLEIAERTLAAREETLGLQQAQYEAGAIDALNLAQARSERESTRAQIPEIRGNRDQAENALAVLLGRSPRALIADQVERGRSLDALPEAPVPPMGLPSELLLRRPDIAAAEQNIAAAAADVGVARAGYYPRLTLTASAGQQSSELNDFLSSGASIWGLALGLTGPIFDFGRTDAQVEAAKSRFAQAAMSYRQTVRTAFREVLDALAARSAAEGQIEAQTAQIAELTRTVELARLRYDAGYADYLDVLDAERTLLNVELSRVSTRRTLYSASVDLYKALGGGWEGLAWTTETVPTEPGTIPVSAPAETGVRG